MAENKISLCSKLMARQGLIVAFAESATASWLCSEFALTEVSFRKVFTGTCEEIIHQTAAAELLTVELKSHDR